MLIAVLLLAALCMLQVWAAESPQERIRNAQHAQQQQPWTQQQQPAALGQLGQQQVQQQRAQPGGLTQQQQQQHQQQNAVQPDAGRASLLPPASPHLQVLNSQRQRRISNRQQPGMQVQVQRADNLEEEQGEVSPAASLGCSSASRQPVNPANVARMFGAAAEDGRTSQVAQQQQQQQQYASASTARGSMPPPPPRMQPSTFRGQVQRLQQQPGQQQTQQQHIGQQQGLGRNTGQQETAGNGLEQLFAGQGGSLGGLLGASTQQQRQQAASQGVQQLRQSQQSSQQQSLNSLQQPPPRSTLPYQLQQRRSSAAVIAPAVRNSTQGLALQSDGMDVDALVADDDDAMDDVVAAIFGSQMPPPPAAGSTASQQQQQPGRQLNASAPDALLGPNQKRFKPATGAAATGAVTGAVLPGSAPTATSRLQQQGKAPGNSQHKAISGGGPVFGGAPSGGFRPQQQQQQQQRMLPPASPAVSFAGSAAGSGGGPASYPGSAKVPSLSVRPFTAAAAGAAAAGASGRGQPLLHGRQAVNLLDDLLGDDLEELDG
jgi:hypothetical protein